MAIIELGGVHGVGKTTTIESAATGTNKLVPVLKGSVIMARILGVSTEDLPTQPAELRQAAREKMFLEINTATNGIRDSHFCVYTDQGYEFPFTESDIGLVSVAVLLEASKETVQKRRMQIERNRPTDISQIEEQLYLERLGAEQSADKLNVPLITIRNEPGDPSAQQMAEVFERYLD